MPREFQVAIACQANVKVLMRFAIIAENCFFAKGLERLTVKRITFSQGDSTRLIVGFSLSLSLISRASQLRTYDLFRCYRLARIMRNWAISITTLWPSMFRSAKKRPSLVSVTKDKFEHGNILCWESLRVCLEVQEILNIHRSCIFIASHV